MGYGTIKSILNRPDLIQISPPETVEEMISMAKTITEKTGIPGLGWGITATEDFANITESFYSSYTGVDIWSDGDKKFTLKIMKRIERCL